MKAGNLERDTFHRQNALHLRRREQHPMGWLVFMGRVIS